MNFQVQMNQTHATGERTLNKKVKSFIKNNILLQGQTITKTKKQHVPGVGYITYFYNEFGIYICRAFKDGMKNGIVIQYHR